jgi:predicted small integral membrane protein
VCPTFETLLIFNATVWLLCGMGVWTRAQPEGRLIVDCLKPYGAQALECGKSDQAQGMWPG